ncbi:MAG: sigma-70 family RNA polymerase sigma factor [Gemmatimonadaceae bacterium]|nr:sigma-70 family RNA polymerase sigma factor [Gemmatimonadaceae bacterium]
MTAAMLDAAQRSEGDALNALIAAVTPRVYALAMRHFLDHDDAADATQDILWKVVQGLPGFRRESRIETWVYRVATNHLLNAVRGRREDASLDDGLAALADGLAASPYDGPDAALLEEEVKVACTTSLLLCLSRPLRLAYVVAEILDLPGPVAADVLEISPAALRKRLEEARRIVRGFFRGQCGIATPTNPCRCSRQISSSLDEGWLEERRPRHGRLAPVGPSLSIQPRDIDGLIDEVAIFRSQADIPVSGDFVAQVQVAIRRRLAVLDLHP